MSETTVKNGQKVSVHYVGTLDDGTEFDNSRSRGDVISFEVGSGQLISGFDSALPGMVVGEVKSVSLTPEEAYGDVNPEAIETVPKNVFLLACHLQSEEWFKELRQQDSLSSLELMLSRESQLL